MSPHRLTATSVERRLWCVEGFAWLHGPGMFGQRAQHSFEVWQAAEARAVVPLLPLREVEASGTAQRCVIYVFWTQDAPAVAVDHLVARAASFDASVIRRESLPYTALSPWRGPGRPLQSLTRLRDEVALALSDPNQGRCVFTLRSPRPANDPTLAVWARLQDVDYIYPVRGDLTR